MMENVITPQNWNLYRLDEVFQIARGGSPRPIIDYITESEDGYNWIKIGDTKNVDKYIYKTKQKIIKEGLKKSLLVKKDDFILSNSMSFGKPYIMKTEGCIHDGWLLLRKLKEDVSVDFMYYVLSSDFIKTQFTSKAAGSTVQNLNIKLVETVKVLLPPLSEQQKIADILSTVDAKMEVIAEQILQTQTLKKGLMQRLLSQGIGHSEFKDSALGRIPKSWEVVSIGDVCKLKGGFAFKSSDSCEKGIRWVKIANVGVNKIKWDDESFLPKGFEVKHNEFILSEGDIVMAMTRPVLSGKLKIARISKTDSGSLLNQRVGKVVQDKNLNKEFAYQFFNSTSFITALEKELMGTDPPNISSSMFETLLIPLPPLAEQQKIASILSAVDAKLEVLEEKKVHYAELKQGLMQQLLTGKIRVR